MTVTVLQLLVNGVALGAAYALIALGFVLVINAVSAVNFAQGDLVMAGGFVAVISADWLSGEIGPRYPGLGLAVLPITVIVMGVFGILFSAIAYAPLRKKPPVAVFISTIAVGIMLQHGANAVFGPEPRIGPPLLDSGTLAIGRLGLSIQQVMVIVAAAGLITMTGLLLSRTQFGRKLRATAQDSEMAEAIGIHGGVCIGLTFALALALAGAAGTLLSNQFLVSPSDGRDVHAEGLYRRLSRWLGSA